MAGEWKCRECRVNVAHGGHLRLPAGAIRGSSALCLSCADRHMEKHHMSSLHDFVPKYVASQKQVSEVAALRQQVREMQALLESLTAPKGV